MPTYSIEALRLGLILQDKPMAYKQARGTAVHFTLSYRKIDGGRSGNAGSNIVGVNWRRNWLSYVQDDPARAGVKVTVATTSGGLLQLDGSTGSSLPSEKQMAPRWCAR